MISYDTNRNVTTFTYVVMLTMLRVDTTANNIWDPVTDIKRDGNEKSHAG
jgi:hypothetical protein